MFYAGGAFVRAASSRRSGGEKPCEQGHLVAREVDQRRRTRGVIVVVLTIGREVPSRGVFSLDASGRLPPRRQLEPFTVCALAIHVSPPTGVQPAFPLVAGAKR